MISLDTTTLYRGEARLERLRLNGYGVLWLTPSRTAAEEYAAPYYRPEGVVLTVHLRPGARAVRLRDAEHPAIRALREKINESRYYTGLGGDLSASWWAEHADFGIFETWRWSAKFLAARKIDAVLVEDKQGTIGMPHESVAILRLSVIASTSSEVVHNTARTVGEIAERIEREGRVRNPVKEPFGFEVFEDEEEATLDPLTARLREVETKFGALPSVQDATPFFKAGKAPTDRIWIFQKQTPQGIRLVAFVWTDGDPNAFAKRVRAALVAPTKCPVSIVRLQDWPIWVGSPSGIVESPPTSGVRRDNPSLLALLVGGSNERKPAEKSTKATAKGDGEKTSFVVKGDEVTFFRSFERTASRLEELRGELGAGVSVPSESRVVDVFVEALRRDPSNHAVKAVARALGKDMPIVCPAEFVVVQDVSGSRKRACDFYICRASERRSIRADGRHVSDAAVDAAKRWYGGDGHVAGRTVNVPDGPWHREAQIDAIWYRRHAVRGLGGRYEHSYSPSVPLYVSSRPKGWRVALPDGCIVDERGFVYP